MEKLTKTEARKILGVLAKYKSKKWISLDFLSQQIGIYSDILAEQLSQFDPLARLDPNFDVRSIEEALKEFAAAEPIKTARAKAVTKKAVSQYSGINDFVYKKMTNAGGLVDRDAVLSDEDLSILRKLVAEETAARRQAKKKK